MQKKTETKFEAIPANSPAIKAAGERHRKEAMPYIPDEEKLAYKIMEARAFLVKILKKDRKAPQFYLEANKEMFKIEDYFLNLSQQKKREYEENLKQPELFEATVSPTNHGV